MFPGQPMHEDKNSGRLLLLRIRTARVQAKPCIQLCQNGIADDRSDQVRGTLLYSITNETIANPTIISHPFVPPVYSND